MSPDKATDTDDAFEAAVRTACDSVLDDPMRSNVVGPADIESHSEVRAATDVSEAALRTEIGTVLTEANYAEKVSRNKYRIRESD